MSKKSLSAVTGACRASVLLAALLLAANATAQPSDAIGTGPHISCAFGKVVNGRCICPPGWRRVHAGYNAWRCLRPDPQIKSKVPGPRPKLQTPRSRPDSVRPRR
jgi:hypothetical protein